MKVSIEVLLWVAVLICFALLMYCGFIPRLRSSRAIWASLIGILIVISGQICLEREIHAVGFPLVLIGAGIALAGTLIDYKELRAPSQLRVAGTNKPWRVKREPKSDILTDSGDGREYLASVRILSKPVDRGETILLSLAGSNIQNVLVFDELQDLADSLSPDLPAIVIVDSFFQANRLSIISQTLRAKSDAVKLILAVPYPGLPGGAYALDDDWIQCTMPIDCRALLLALEGELD